MESFSLLNSGFVPILQTLISFIVVLGVVVFVHELGHFLAAKFCGVRVDVFSLGFPPKMVGFTYGQTEYRIGWVPLGGYVKIAGMIDESLDDEVITGAPDEFMSKGILAKSFIITAGVLMNFLLGIVLYSVVAMVDGKITGVNTEPVIGTINPGYPAEEHGIMPGDRILSVEGVSMQYWDQMADFVHQRPGETLSFTWLHDGDTLSEQIQTSVQLETIPTDELPQNTIGLIPGNDDLTVRGVYTNFPAFDAGIEPGDRILSVDTVEPAGWEEFNNYVQGVGNSLVLLKWIHETDTLLASIPAFVPDEVLEGQVETIGTIGLEPESPYPSIVGSVETNSPADLAGLQAGDLIISIMGESIDTWRPLDMYVQVNPGDTLLAQFVRSSDTLNAVIPIASVDRSFYEITRNKGLIGIGPALLTSDVNIVSAIGDGFQMTGRIVLLTFDSIGRLITREASIDEVAGPVGIFQMTGVTIQMGWTTYVGFMALISISIGLLNIMPFPVLDGGHLVIILIEGISRKTISTKVKLVIQQLGIALLLILFLAVTYHDVSRLFAN